MTSERGEAGRSNGGGACRKRGGERTGGREERAGDEQREDRGGRRADDLGSSWRIGAVELKCWPGKEISRTAVVDGRGVQRSNGNGRLDGSISWALSSSPGKGGAAALVGNVVDLSGRRRRAASLPL
jgi:hypothetical protein